MKSRGRLSGILVVVALVQFIVLVGCGDDPSKPDSDKEDPPEVFVLISTDTFTMGSPADEIDRVWWEGLHKVTLTTPFYMFATEVTNQQYAEMAQWAYDQDPPLVTATIYSLQDALGGSTQELLNLDGHCEISFSEDTFIVDSGKEVHPVQDVTWYGAAAYCDWLSLHEGLPRAYDHDTWQCNGQDVYNAPGYRLPTEAEWEYACRAWTLTPFNTGTCLDAGTEANCDGTNPYSDCPAGLYVGWTVPVGSYPENTFDLYDMHGNLWEWCNDAYGLYSGDITDPVGAANGDFRVLRGGDWSRVAGRCRSAQRNNYAPFISYDMIGFRPVRSAD